MVSVGDGLHTLGGLRDLARLGPHAPRIAKRVECLCPEFLIQVEDELCRNVRAGKDKVEVVARRVLNVIASSELV